MAFVFRSERTLTSSISDTDVGPGEYIPTIPSQSHMKDILSSNLRPPFNTSSSRKSPFLTTVDNTPGPGTYEKILPTTEYDLYKEFPHLKHKKHNNRDFYKAVEFNVLPPLYIDAIEKKSRIAFNTRVERFHSLSDLLNKTNSYPGPGKYNVARSFIKKENQDKKSTIKFTEFNTVFSPHRISTIPSKETFGYDFIDGVPQMLTDPDGETKTSGVKTDTIGPGQYDVSPKWDKNIVEWGKMSNRKSSEKTSSLTEAITTTKASSVEHDKKSTSVSKVFDKFMNQRYEKSKLVKENLMKKSDFVFDTTPGPGYYTQEFNVYGLNDDTIKKSSLQSFGIRDKRFRSEKRDNNCEVGPGLYYELNKPKKKKKYNLKNKSIVDKTTKKEKPGLQIELQKTDTTNMIGPGSYELSKNIIKDKKLSSVEEFGVKEKKFFFPTSGTVNTPGPGSYINSIEFTSGSLIGNDKNATSSHKEIETILKTSRIEKEKDDEKDEKETNKKYKAEHFEPPPVGLYNPYIVKSILYKIKSNINPFQDKKKVSFGSQEKRFDNNKTNTVLGPGIYYKDKKPYYKQNFTPFNVGNIRFNYKIKGTPVPGPGAYEQSSFEDWNKKSHNILFV